MKIKFILPAMLAVSIAFTSCKKDNEETAPADLSKDEGKALVEATSTRAKQDVTDLQESTGGTALDNLTGLLGSSEGENPLGRGYKGKRGKAFRRILGDFKSSIRATQSKTSEEEAAWDFEGNKGTYTYNNSTEDFDLTDSTTDAVVIIFPAGSDLTVNNATVTVSEYTEDADGQPTRLDGDLKVDGEVVTSIDYTGAFDGEGQPTSLELTFVIVPFELKAELDKQSDTKMSGSSSLTQSGSTIYDVAGDIEFKTAELEDLVSLSGHVQYGDVRVSGSVDGTRMEELDNQEADPTSEEINSAFSATITQQSTSAKIGDIIAADYTDEMDDTYPNLYIRYNDGSLELAEDAFKSVIEDIEEFIEELEADFEEDEVAVRN